MRIEETTKFLENFVSCSKPVFGNIEIKITDHLDAANFPDEIEKLDKKNGVYIIWSKNDQRVIYVGIAVDIPRRIYQHIGKGFSWARGGGKASFPNCTLADGRFWLEESTQDELRNAEWNITCVLPSPENLRGLLESALIFWGMHNGKKPEINVEL